MKKVIISVVVVALVLVMMFTFTACNKYKWGPVGTTEYSSENAVGNGTLAVKQGKYLYFVNNVASDDNLTKDDNEWGANGTNGAIMKSKINDDGTLECLGIVVPKMFCTDATDAGIYVYGEWIYYVARSQKTDNKGSLISAVEFLRTKTDGTATESLATVEDLTAAYLFTQTGLIYTYDSNIYYVDYTGKKPKESQVVTKYTGVKFSVEDKCVFYTQDSGSDYILANHLGVVLSDGSTKTIIAEDAYHTGDGDYRKDLSHLFTLAIIDYDPVENAIYYSKTCKDAQAKVTTNGVVLGTDFTFSLANEKTYANSALSSIYMLGTTYGVMDVSSGTVVAYAPMTDDIHEIKSEEVTFTSTIVILFQQGDYTYYLMNAVLYRANLINADHSLNKNAYEEKISGVTFSTTLGAPSYLDGYIYYASSDDATYLSRIKLASYDSATQKLIKGYIVSGYKNYTYPDDCDYVINKDDEEIKDKVPAYITDKDLETYISNHKSDKED